MEPNNSFPTSDDGKTAGIISYLTIIGWLIAYFAIHQNNKTALGSYQLRQTLLFHIASMVVSWILGMIFYSLFLTGGFFSALSLSWIVRVGFFVLWLIGFIGAINGEKKPIPLIGEKAQTIFSTI
ncbi:MAG TPA: hypothetical protein VK668_02260 [Mucilaginibacter sp.]|nr:hypothetical protein [Mucilaginibacter sp.]